MFIFQVLNFPLMPLLSGADFEGFEGVVVADGDVSGTHSVTLISVRDDAVDRDGGEARG